MKNKAGKFKVGYGKIQGRSTSRNPKLQNGGTIFFPGKVNEK